MKERLLDVFLKNIDVNLSFYENIDILYYHVNFQPVALWYHLHHVLKHYFNEFTWDVAKDGIWLKINNVKYYFNNSYNIIPLGVSI